MLIERKSVFTHLILVMIVFVFAIMMSKQLISNGLTTVGILVIFSLLVILAVRIDLCLFALIFFLLVPFSLSTHRLQQISDISNFMIVYVFIIFIIKKIQYRRRFDVSPLTAPTIAFLSLIVLSYFRDPRPLTDNTVLVHVVSAFSIMLFIILSNMANNNKEILYKVRHAIFIFFNIGLLMAVAVALFHVVIPFTAAMGWYNRSGSADILNSGGVTSLGVYGFGSFLFLLAQPSYIKHKWLRQFLMLLYLAVIPFGGTRSILLSIIGSVLVFALITRKKLQYVILLGISFFVVGYFVTTNYYDLPQVIERNFNFSLEGSSRRTRTSMWEASFILWERHPVFGIGYSEISRSMLPFDPYHNLNTFSRAPHNSFVYVLRSSGLVGISLLFWMFLRFFKLSKYLLEKIKDNKIQDFIKFIIIYEISSIIGFFFSGNMQKPSAYLPFGLLSGIYIYYLNENKEKKRSTTYFK